MDWNLEGYMKSSALEHQKQRELKKMNYSVSEQLYRDSQMRQARQVFIEEAVSPALTSGRPRAQKGR
jgi:hypothetical protein